MTNLFPKVVDDSQAIVAVIRGRLDELRMSHASLENLAGLASGHVGKVLGPAPVKRFGLDALWLVLPALGLKMVIEQDMDAVRVMEKRWEIRDELRRRPGLIRRRYTPELKALVIAEAARERINVLNARTSPEDRADRARKAARARWRRMPKRQRKVIARAMVAARRRKRRPLKAQPPSRPIVVGSTS